MVVGVLLGFVAAISFRPLHLYGGTGSPHGWGGGRNRIQDKGVGMRLRLTVQGKVESLMLELRSRLRPGLRLSLADSWCS